MSKKTVFKINAVLTAKKNSVMLEMTIDDKLKNSFQFHHCDDVDIAGTFAKLLDILNKDSE
jgi:hypothetical protein